MVWLGFHCAAFKLAPSFCCSNKANLAWFYPVLQVKNGSKWGIFGQLVGLGLFRAFVLGQLAQPRDGAVLFSFLNLSFGPYGNLKLGDLYRESELPDMAIV